VRQGAAGGVLQALPYGLDPTTLKLRLRRRRAGEGVSLYERVLTEARTAQLRDLDAQIEALQVQMHQQQQARERALAERGQAESLRGAAVPFLNREAAVEKRRTWPPGRRPWTPLGCFW
jgi:hypothetical protein